MNANEAVDTIGNDNTAKHYIGRFNGDELSNKKDKAEVEKAREIYPALKYNITKEIKKNGKVVALDIWICDFKTFAKEGSI